MKKLSAVLLALGLMAGSVQASEVAQKQVVISVEAKDLSSSMTTLVGSPVTVTSGLLQKAPNQALCVIVDVNKHYQRNTELSEFDLGDRASGFERRQDRQSLGELLAQ